MRNSLNCAVSRCGRSSTYQIYSIVQLPVNFANPETHIPTTRENLVAISSADTNRLSPKISQFQDVATYCLCGFIGKHVRYIFKDVNTIVLPNNLSLLFRIKYFLK